MMNIYNETAKINCVRPTAVALGAFDGLHPGHMKVIGAALSSGYEASVFTFSQLPTKSRQGRLMTEADKLLALEESGVQNVFNIRFDEVRNLDPEEFFKEVLLKKCKAACISCGENYRFGRGAAGGTALLEKLCADHGVGLKVSEPVMLDGEVISSTGIRGALKKGDVQTANRMLGHPFYFTLPVVGGNRIGRTLGTPTINQLLPDNFVLPRFGVYASLADIGGEKHWGVTNIGTKPTVGKYAPLSETWIGEFKGDLYGKNIRLELLDFIREERKFESLEALKAEILRNAEAARIAAKPFMGT